MITPKKVARILSIDGGGIRGLIPATIITEWEKNIGPISNSFHMVAGTSTGGILACALSRPDSVVPAKELVSFYQKKGPSIFSASSVALGGALGNIYDSAPLESAVKEVLGDTSLSKVSACDLLATSYEIEARFPFLFKSWRAQGIEAAKMDAPINDFLLRDVARATSAAPTYFQPARIQNVHKDSFALVDGGVFANNPAMCAYVAARRLYPLADEFLIVSIGTGQTLTPYQYDDAISWGLVGWARPLLDIMFSGVSDSTSYELDQLAPSVNHFRFQSSLEGASEDMDDVSQTNLSALISVGQRTNGIESKKVAEMLALLKSPKTPRNQLGYPSETASTILPKIKSIVAPSKPSDAPGILAGAIAGGAVGGAIGGPIGLGIGAVLGAVGVRLVPDEEKKG